MTEASTAVPDPGQRPSGPRRLDPRSIERLLAPAGDELDDARRLLRDVLEHVPVVSTVQSIVEVDGELRAELDYMGPELGRSMADEAADEEHAASWRHRVGPALLQDFSAMVQDHWRSGVEQASEEVWFLDASGSRKAVDVRLVYDHEAGRLYSFSLDVTSRRAAEQVLADNEQLLQAVLEGSPDLIVVTDLEGRMLFVSDSAGEHLGLQPAEAGGASMFEWVHPDDIPEAVDLSRRIIAGEIDVGRIRARGFRRDGRVAVFDAQARLLRRRDGGVIGLLGLVRDVSPELEIEAGLRAARDQAQQANQARDAFLSRMSHELRTPLNAVLGFAQLLEGSLTHDRDLDSVAHIRRAGAHLLRLLDEVLDLARIESGAFSVDLGPVGLADAVDEALGFVRPMARAQSIRVDSSAIDPDAWVEADRPRLLQVLLNLLSNAVKFNRPGGRVAVDVTPTADGASWSVAVTDTGPGMTEAELERLFTPFERLGADERGVSGTGIGLVLSRSLAEQMGGSVSVRSEAGLGSTFAVRLRRVAPEAAAGTATVGGADRAVSRTTQPLQVLYIEDNSANRDLIRQVLAAAGNDQLALAPTGATGVRAAIAEPPDVVLLDLHLPDMDGVEVMHRIRSQPGLDRVPIVVISADATRRQVARVLEEGADHYLTKPIDLAELLATLDRYRYRHRYRWRDR